MASLLSALHGPSIGWRSSLDQSGARKWSEPRISWRIRVADYRIVYQVNDDLLVVLVLRIGHRREVYD